MARESPIIEQMDGGHCQHDGEEPFQVPFQLAALHSGEIHTVHDDLGDLELLVDALHHDAFIDRLALPTDEVVIEVQIQIAQLFHIGKGLIGDDIVHIEGVLGQLETALAQHFGAVDQRVHDHVLGRIKEAHIVPGADLAGTEGRTELDSVAGILIEMVIDVSCRPPDPPVRRGCPSIPDSPADGAGPGYPASRPNPPP